MWPWLPSIGLAQPLAFLMRKLHPGQAVTCRDNTTSQGQPHHPSALLGPRGFPSAHVSGCREAHAAGEPLRCWQEATWATDGEQSSGVSIY